MELRLWIGLNSWLGSGVNEKVVGAEAQKLCGEQMFLFSHVPRPTRGPRPAPTLYAPGKRGPTSGHWCPRVLEAEVGRVTTEEGCHYKHVSTLSPSQLPFTSPQDMMYGRSCLLLELPWMRFGNTTMPAIFSTYLTFLCTSFSKLSQSFVGTFLNLTTMHAWNET